MNLKRDKKIAEALGLCWHKNEYDIDWGWGCSKCETLFKSEFSNPNFSTAEGELLILQEGPERDWWEEFINYIGAIVDYENTARCAYMPMELIQSPDRLADKLYEYLDGKDEQ